MYKNLEYLYLTLRIFISTIFERFTCRTKPDYQACNYDEEDAIYFKPSN